MSDQVIEQNQHAGQHDPAQEHGASDRVYVMVAIFLALMTGLEVLASYTKDHLGPFEDPALLIMMVIKFFTVCLFFMHLKYDPKMCQRVFFFGLGIATTVYIIMLSTFRFWPHGFR